MSSGISFAGFPRSSASCNSRSAWFQNSSSLSVALFPEFVSTLSDLIFCWPIHCGLPPRTACPGGSPGRKGEAVQAANVGTTRQANSSQLRLFPKEKLAWRGRPQAGLSLVEAPGDRASLIVLPVKYSVPSCFRSRLRHRLKLMFGSVPGV